MTNELGDMKTGGMSGATVVPFGKYKGQPVETMLADTEYMAWLEAQPWFRQRFSNLMTQKDQDALSRTPVHNRLQSLFLKSAYCAGFVEVVWPKWSRDIGTAERLAKDIEEMIIENYSKSSWDRLKEDDIKGLRVVQDELMYYPTLTARKIWTTFERNGADVYFVLQAEKYHLHKSNGSYSAGKTMSEDNEFRIEIKPVVADDYPAVLRQMNRNQTQYLFVGGYSGEGATREEFVDIFECSGKTVVFKDDLDRHISEKDSF